VTLTSGFYIGVYPVTEAQYDWIMDSVSTSGSAYPKANISWNMLRSGANSPNYAVGSDPSGAGSVLWKLRDEVFTATGIDLKFDLPSEAQWEFACRAGTRGTFNDDDTIETTEAGQTIRLNSLGWWRPISGNTIQPVGSFPTVAATLPNRAGLYDMHGNIRECCRDAFDRTPGQTDLPGVPVVDRLREDGADRVMRGGAFNNALSKEGRSAMRVADTPTAFYTNLGFRLSATGPAVP
jgi:formylglycine-generating enzyme required for sulfatase activity